jgi:hypothetical protein
MFITDAPFVCSSNALGDGGGVAIAAALPSLISLKTLIMSSNVLGGQSKTKLETLGRHVSLRRI